MDFSELILLLHNEVQKCYDYVDASSKANDENQGGIHIAMDKIELELPISLTEVEIKHTKEDFKKFPVKLQAFKRPFDAQFYGERIEKFDLTKIKKLEGKKIGAKIISQSDNSTDAVIPELITRMRITLRPIIK
jgi:hypothetical protein